MINPDVTDDIFEIGLGKQSITTPPRGEILMGWGDPKQRALAIAMPIYARATVIKTATSVFALACLEICFVTQTIRNQVIERLQTQDPSGDWKEENVLLCATHTHCAPGGHTHDVIYNLPSFGWYPHVIEKYVSGAVAAILEASLNRTKARIRFAEGEFEMSEQVAFNRSIDAWNANPEVEKRSFKERDRALDRRMRLFRFEGLDGKFMGCLNEFAVHCTSIHRDHSVIHPDNKGIAADLMEKELGGVCIFIQGAAGDVSPNFQRFAGLREVRGTDRDDFESARKNGVMQSDLAIALAKRAIGTRPLLAELDSAIEYVNFADIKVDSKDAGGFEGARTGPAVIGARALLGTDEGMPTPKIAYRAAIIFSRGADLLEYVKSGFQKRFLWNCDPVQGSKIGCLQLGEGQVFRARGFENSVVPSFIDPAVATLKRWSRKKILARALSPQILPIQSIRLGDWIWVSVPSEFTTMSGLRLKKSVLEDLKSTWAKHALLIGYANSYSGYVTTPEEYQLQLYEGASTHFGQWTQPAYQTAFRSLVKKLLKPKSERPTVHIRPPNLTKQELEELLAPSLV